MTWTSAELDRVGAADELQVSSRRADGSLRPYVTIWVVRVGDDLYVRSASGPGNGWYRRAVAAGAGRIRAGGVERDVRFEPAGQGAAAAIDEAYHAKYDRYPKEYVDPVVGPDAAGVTLRLVTR
jgi:hypothetical protein